MNVRLGRASLDALDVCLNHRQSATRKLHAVFHTSHGTHAALGSLSLRRLRHSESRLLHGNRPVGPTSAELRIAGKCSVEFKPSCRELANDLFRVQAADGMQSDRADRAVLLYANHFLECLRRAAGSCVY